MSGGPDSLSLLRLALQWGERPIVALHVNHGVRAEADTEQEWLLDKLRGTDCIVSRLEWTSSAEKRSHEHLRQRRYAKLQEMAHSRGLQALLLAHHADDLAETLLERVQMASGLAGLARPVAEISLLPGLPPLLRPALGFSKSELRSVLGPSEVVLNDPSNLNPRYLRSRVRQALDELPLARERVALVHQLVSREWAAIEAHPVPCPSLASSLGLLSDRGIGGEAARLALRRRLNEASGGSPRAPGSLLRHAADWMTRSQTIQQSRALFSESGVTIEWKKKTQTFRLRESLF